MNVFEEHQLFIPIINDSRFAPTLADMCALSRRVSFNRCAFEAIHAIRAEGNLSISVTNRELLTVQQELWEYYKHLEDEERAIQARINIDAKPSQTEHELGDWKQHAARACRTTDDVVDAPNNPPQQIPKESPIVATPTFTTITYVSGKPIGDLGNEDLINAIKACEKEIDSLNEVKRPSTKIRAKIDELNATADKIRDALDARV